VGLAHIYVLHPLWLWRLIRANIRLVFERWDQVPFSDASSCAENDEQTSDCNGSHHSAAAFVSVVSRFKNVV